MVPESVGGEPVADWRALTAGCPCLVGALREGVTVVLEAGTPLSEDDMGRQLEAGWPRLVLSGSLRMADGTTAHAVLWLDPRNSYSLEEVAVWLPSGGLATQGTDGHAEFLRKLGKARDAVWPYRYSYAPTRIPRDPHIEEDGWSY